MSGTMARDAGAAPDFLHPEELVTFLIGKEKTAFKLHKDHACFYSSAFRAAFDGQFIEGRTQQYILEDAEPDVFRLVVMYLYYQKLDFRSYTTQVERTQKFGTNREAFLEDDLNLVKLWVLADKYLMPKLQNLAMDEMIKRLNLDDATVPIHTFSYVYENSAEGSKLRELVVFECILLAPNDFQESKDHFPKALLLEYAAFANGIMSDEIEKPELLFDSSDFYVSDEDA